MAQNCRTPLVLMSPCTKTNLCTLPHDPKSSTAPKTGFVNNNIPPDKNCKLTPSL